MIRFTCLLATAFAWVLPAIAVAQPIPGNPIKLSEVRGKSGAFRLTLTERSPLSNPREIIRRIQAKPGILGTDYDLSQQIFEVYVPKAPGDDGKYGLMVGLPILAGNGWTPAAWKPVLDKYHMIWIGPNDGGDRKQPTQRIGQMLDVAFNAQKAWKIDTDRLYAGVISGSRPTSGVGLYYPDVFAGVFEATQLSWFGNLPDIDRPTRTWHLEHMPRPLDDNLAMAKSHSRFFFATRDVPTNDVNLINDIIFRNGYQASGFKYVKTIKVPVASMDVWTNYTSEWLDEGLKYLDASLAEVKASPQESVAPPNPAGAAAAANPATSAPTGNAAADLSLAKNYVSLQKFDLARPRLQKIIETYPNTPAAREAKTILDQIKGK